MKKQCENQRFLMAQNHVWRYTLRLFHTFAIFEKKQKNRCQNGAPKSCFLVQKRASDAAGSINSAIWSVFGRFQKSLSFCCRSECPKIMKNQSVGRSPCRSSDAGLAKVVVPGGKKGGYRRYTIGDSIGNWIWHADPVGRRIFVSFLRCHLKKTSFFKKKKVEHPFWDILFYVKLYADFEFDIRLA